MTLSILDARDNAASRERAKLRLKEATQEKPHGIINVGIFGEGTDSPSLKCRCLLESAEKPA